MSKLDRILKILLSRNKKSKRRYPMAAAGVVAAVLGALIKAATLTKTFPEPFDIYIWKYNSFYCCSSDCL